MNEGQEVIRDSDFFLSLLLKFEGAGIHIFARLEPVCMLSWCLLTKFQHFCIRSSLRVILLVGSAFPLTLDRIGQMQEGKAQCRRNYCYLVLFAKVENGEINAVAHTCHPQLHGVVEENWWLSTSPS